MGVRDVGTGEGVDVNRTESPGFWPGVVRCNPGGRLW